MTLPIDLAKKRTECSNRLVLNNPATLVLEVPSHQPQIGNGRRIQHYQACEQLHAVTSLVVVERDLWDESAEEGETKSIQKAQAELLIAEKQDLVAELDALIERTIRGKAILLADIETLQGLCGHFLTRPTAPQLLDQKFDLAEAPTTPSNQAPPHLAFFGEWQKVNEGRPANLPEPGAGSAAPVPPLDPVATDNSHTQDS